MKKLVLLSVAVAALLFAGCKGKEAEANATEANVTVEANATEANATVEANATEANVTVEANATEANATAN
ncbi:MAG: hypothetical protein IE890_12315 [Arcobacter sp.]|nr:hypothetical protein [Arcobacter sp.]